MLYDSEMNVIGSASRDTVVYTPEPGASEIDMTELWNSFCSASLELKETYPVEMSHLIGLGISGQGDGLWPLDQDFHPACRAILWSDFRSKEMNIDSIPGISSLLSENCMNMVFAGSMPGIQKCLKIKFPEIYARIRYSLHCKDWLNFCLTNRIVSDYTDITCSSGMSLKTKRLPAPLWTYSGTNLFRQTIPS